MDFAEYKKCWRACAAFLGDDARQSNIVGTQRDVFLQQRWMVVLRHLDNALPAERPAAYGNRIGVGLRRTAFLRRDGLPARRFSYRPASGDGGASLGAGVARRGCLRPPRLVSFFPGVGEPPAFWSSF